LLPPSSTLIAQMMEAASMFETSVNFYQNTQRNNPEDSRLEFLACFYFDEHKDE
jgi:hypothetical protein